MSILVPSNEKRLFNCFTLDNGIKCLTIQDEMDDKTSIVVNVSTGSRMEPVEYQGLAHFLEHMLFMGSEKYPEEDYINKVLSKNGGYTNAYTDNNNTVYYCCANNSQELIIDIFSRFFIDPLFSEDGVNREINAINSEFMKNINSDTWRFYHFVKMISKDDSEINKFDIGSLESLQHNNLRERMIEFYNDYYVPENITIVTTSNLDNETMKEYLTKSFSSVPVRKSKSISFSKPYYDFTRDNFYFIKTLKDENSINYVFEYDNTNNQFLYTHTPSLISKMIQNNEENSLNNFLVKRGLIKSMMAYPDNDLGIFYISFTLNNLNDFQLVDSYFKYYLFELRKENWNNIIKFNMNLDEVNFNTMEKVDSLGLAIYLSSNLHKYEMNEVFKGGYVIRDLNTKEVDNFFNNFLRSKVILQSNNFNNLNSKYWENVSGELTEKYYGFKYCNIDLKFDIKRRFKYDIVLDETLFNINPENIDGLDSTLDPLVVDKKYTNGLTIWFGNVSKFNEPVVKSSMIFTNKDFMSDINEYYMLLLFIKYVNYKLSTKFYHQREVGFKSTMSVDNTNSKIGINIDGKNDGFVEYYNKVINYITGLVYNEEDNKVVDTMIESQRLVNVNIKKSTPMEFRSYIITLHTNDNYYSSGSSLTAIKRINHDNFKNNFIFIRDNLFSNAKITGLFYGNIEKETLFGEGGLEFNFNSQERPSNRLKLVPDISVVHPNKEEGENIYQVLYHMGEFDPRRTALLYLLNDSISQQFFTELRTKQQFGYITSASLMVHGDYYYFSELIQTSKKPSVVKNAINKFNSEFIKTFTREVFEEHVKGCIRTLRENETTLDELVSKYYGEILRNRFMFNKNELLVSRLEKITFEEFIDFYNNRVLNGVKSEVIIYSSKSN